MPRNPYYLQRTHSTHLLSLWIIRTVESVLSLTWACLSCSSNYPLVDREYGDVLLVESPLSIDHPCRLIDAFKLSAEDFHLEYSPSRKSWHSYTGESRLVKSDQAWLGNRNPYVKRRVVGSSGDRRTHRTNRSLTVLRNSVRLATTRHRRHRSRMDTCYVSVNRESGLRAVAGLMSKCGVPKKVTLVIGEKAA